MALLTAKFRVADPFPHVVITDLVNGDTQEVLGRSPIVRGKGGPTARRNSNPASGAAAIST